MLRLAGSICSRHRTSRGHFEKGTWLGQPAWGAVSGFLKATSAGHSSDQSDRSLMHLDGAGQFTFLASSLRKIGTRARRSDLRLEGRRRIAEIMWGSRLLSRVSNPGYLGCCFIYSSHAALPPEAHAAGRRTSSLFTWSPFRQLPAQGQETGTPALGRSSSLGRCCSKVQIGKNNISYEAFAKLLSFTKFS